MASEGCWNQARRNCRKSNIESRNRPRKCRLQKMNQYHCCPFCSSRFGRYEPEVYPVPVAAPFEADRSILSLPPTARLVSGVSTPAPPLAPRSITLRRDAEMAPGLEALEACCGVGPPAVAALVRVRGFSSSSCGAC